MALVQVDEQFVADARFRDDSGRPVTLSLTPPDEDGVSSLVFEVHERTPGLPEDGEVFFLTSRDRLTRAYRRWYNVVGIDSDDDASAQARVLMRYLDIPTVEEVNAYRDS